MTFIKNCTENDSIGSEIKIEGGIWRMGTTGRIATVLLIIGLLLFVAVPDIVTCPKCHGYIKQFNWIPGVECPVCGEDGKISILHSVILAIKPAASLDDNEGGKVWSDGYVGLTLDEVERKLKEGDDRVVVHLTITRIEGRHILVERLKESMDFSGKFCTFGTGNGGIFDKSLLLDVKGDKYTPKGYSYQVIERQSEDVKYGEIVDGPMLLTFEMPKDREPALLRFVYNFTESLEKVSIEEGEIEIDLQATPEENGVPGFEAAFAIAGLLAVAYLVRRRKSLYT